MTGACPILNASGFIYLNGQSERLVIRDARRVYLNGRSEGPVIRGAVGYTNFENNLKTVFEAEKGAAWQVNGNADGFKLICSATI